MAQYGVALDLPLTAHQMKYSVPVCGILETFHTRIRHEKLISFLL